MGRVLKVLPMGFLLGACLVLGCVGGLFQPSNGRNIAAEIAADNQWKQVVFDAGRFRLRGYVKRQASGKDLVVYIEGDGHAWLERDVPSPDPTPRNPMGLRLAARDPHPRVLYLARPGQYLEPERLSSCPNRFWTSARFSKTVVTAMSQALDQAKQAMAIERIHLVGYSGGGALAVLLAAERIDVKSVLTVCGNLDHAAWTRHHGVSPLVDSLNPAAVASKPLFTCPQVHLVGDRDSIVPPLVSRSYLRRIGFPGHVRLVILKSFDHASGWVEHWPDLLQRYLQRYRVQPLHIMQPKGSVGKVG